MKILLLLLILTGVGTFTYAHALLTNNERINENSGETDTPTIPDEETNEDAENVES